MKYRAKIAGPSGERNVEVEVQLDPTGVVVSLDGRQARWDVVPTPGGGFSVLRADGRQAEAVPRRRRERDRPRPGRSRASWRSSSSTS